MNFPGLLKTALAFLALASLSACAPAKMTTTSAARSAGLVGNSVNSISCKGKAGRVYSASGSSLEQGVLGLVSATDNPNLFGTIDGSATATQTCVALEGRLSYDASGAVNLSQTSMTLTIYDSKVGSVDANGSTIEGFEITFAKATSGQVLADKSFTLQFSDSYGTIQFSGTVGSAVTGTINYQNYSSYATGVANASGTLGAFTIPAASFAY
jgi:ABC-type amino acid transport substrate-binding protein